MSRLTVAQIYEANEGAADRCYMWSAAWAYEDVYQLRTNTHDGKSNGIDPQFCSRNKCSMDKADTSIRSTSADV